MGQTQPNGRISDAAGRRAAGRVAARSFVKAFGADQRGATAIEYGLIVSLIFLVILTAVTSFGNNTSSMIIMIGNTIGSST